MKIFVWHIHCLCLKNKKAELPSFGNSAIIGKVLVCFWQPGDLYETTTYGVKRRKLLVELNPTPRFKVSKTGCGVKFSHKFTSFHSVNLGFILPLDPWLCLPQFRFAKLSAGAPMLAF